MTMLPSFAISPLLWQKKNFTQSPQRTQSKILRLRDLCELCVSFFDARNKIKILTLAALIAAADLVASAQHHTGHAPATNFSDFPAPPLMRDIGTASIKVTTKSPKAQKQIK
jgi:hypothetical protein